MTFQGWAQIALYVLAIVVITKPLGGYMTRVFSGERTLLSPVLKPIERLLYRAGGVDETREQSWVTYAIAMLFFSIAGFVTLYLLQRLQAYLPFNPQGQVNIEQSSAFNTSVSFVTNTNWQSYVPETTMSYLVQMAGLTVHNFLSAATGIALALALVRGFARRQSNTVGNFWVDITRCTLYLLLPVSIVVGLFFVWQGMPQNLHAYTEIATLEGGKQLIAQGPVASQEVIKMFGTNGGGFFNANSAHPFENPNALTNFIQIVLIFSIGAALTNVFGRMVGDQRQGWAIFAVMGILFLGGVSLCYWAEGKGNPQIAALGVDQTPSALQSGGTRPAVWLPATGQPPLPSSSPSSRAAVTSYSSPAPTCPAALESQSPECRSFQRDRFCKSSSPAWLKRKMWTARCRKLFPCTSRRGATPITRSFSSTTANSSSRSVPAFSAPGGWTRFVSAIHCSSDNSSARACAVAPISVAARGQSAT